MIALTPMSSTELPDPARIRIRHRVEWLDTDAAGIYHWSTVIRFAEAAEAALHNALAITELTFGSTPRLSVSFEFARPLRFNDEVTVDYAVEHVGRSSVRYGIVVRDDQDRIAATGAITTCLVDASLSGSRPWPEQVRAALTGAGEQRVGGSAGDQRVSGTAGDRRVSGATGGRRSSPG
jgi:acyl-CoA thioesterase FadM